jgi:hypothetical protein
MRLRFRLRSKKSKNTVIVGIKYRKESWLRKGRSVQTATHTLQLLITLAIASFVFITTRFYIPTHKKLMSYIL